jgi:murein tripeptide amidase MpaA
MRSLVLFLLLLISVFCFQSYQGYGVYRLKNFDNRAVKLISLLENESLVDVWARNDEFIDVMVSPSNVEVVLKFIGSANIKYEKMIPDVEELIQNQMRENEKVTSDDFHTKYHNHDEIVARMNELQKKYPAFVKVKSIGETEEKRKIMAIEISKGGPKVFLYTGGMHAREWIGPASMMYLVDYLLNSIGTNNEIDKILETVSFYIVPVTNVDGYAYTWSGNRMWRKTRSLNGRCYGVDPNRNFDFEWAKAGSSSDPCSETYHGPKAASELCVQAIQTYIRSIPDLVNYIDWHAYSQLFMRPWGYTTTAPKDEAEMKKIGDEVATAMSAKHGTKYRSGRIANIIYQVSGSSSDFVYGTLGKFSYAAELRDTGRYGFILPPAQIIPQGEEIVDAVKVMVKYA